MDPMESLLQYTVILVRVYALSPFGHLVAFFCFWSAPSDLLWSSASVGVLFSSSLMPVV